MAWGTGLKRRRWSRAIRTLRMKPLNFGRRTGLRRKAAPNSASLRVARWANSGPRVRGDGWKAGSSVGWA